MGRPILVAKPARVALADLTRMPGGAAVPAADFGGAGNGTADAAAALNLEKPQKPATNGLPAFQPKGPRVNGTMVHQVSGRETLTSLAVRFRMTESELCTLNKLLCRSVFPGQSLYVRDPDATDYTFPSSQKGVGGAAGGTDSDEAHEMVEVERLSSDICENFVNNTMALLKVLYVTEGKGMVTGVLEANCDYVRFNPDPGMVVDEYGEAEFTLHFEHTDLLQPITQHEVPDMLLDDPVDVGPGGAHHRSMMGTDSPEARRHNSCPQYLQLRVRLIFGQDPTPATVGVYWFAVMPEWMDPLFALLWKHNDEAARDPWEIVSPPTPTIEVAVDQFTLQLDTSLTMTGSLAQKSELIDNESINELSGFMPRRQQHADWKLAYSTYEHGMSLSALYRKMKGPTEACITIVRDTKGHIFGAFTTDTWRNAGEKYYGSGESFLFKLKPTLRTFLWTGKNQYFMMGSETHVMIGGGTGVAGLWLDEALMHGSSGATTTFNNDCLASSPDFMIDGVEIWTFEEPEF